MKTSLRAFVAVVLLAGFPVLVLLVIAGLALLEFFVAQHAIFLAAKLLIVAVPIAFVLFKALLAVERTTDEGEDGVALTPEAQPALWALVRELAAEVGTRPPDEITLIPVVNAMVMEKTRWLGLSVVRRRMYIGAQLFAGLRRDQLCALLVHELAHYSNQDTRLSGLTYRGRKSIVLALSGLDGKGFVSGLVRMLFVFYAKLYFAVSSAVCRRQELAADAAAARVAGTEAAASALREVETLAVSWKFFMNTYAGIGWNAGYLPSRFAQGFRSLLADDTRAKEIDEVRRNLPEEKTSRYDSHPATHERIAALHALPELPMRPGDDVPASEILRDAAGLLDQALLTNLSDEAKRKKRTDWETLVDVGIRHDIAETASKILGTRTLGDLLDLLDAGRAVELADPDEKPPATAGPRAQREFFATSIRERLSIVASLALADAGAARWALSWSGPAEFVVAEPHRDALTPALDAATAVEADTAPLRALLAAAGVPAGYRPAVPARS